MAIKLVTEVMDWAPSRLTHREHKALIVLAENARLPSREIWDSVESPRLLRRARLSQREMYAVIAALIEKGCLVNHVWAAETTAPSTPSPGLPYRDQAARQPLMHSLPGSVLGSGRP